MSSTTINTLQLTKLDNGEEVDSWDQHTRDNSDKIDLYTSYALALLANAAGSQADTTAIDVPTLAIGSADALAKRLANAMEADGTPKELPTQFYARLSRRYGGTQGIYEAAAYLAQELYWAAQGFTNTTIGSQHDALRNMVAERRPRNCLLSGTPSLSAPSSTPAVSPGAGSAWFDIDGKRYELRATKSSSSGVIAGKSTCFVKAVPGSTADQTVYATVSNGVFVKSGSPTDAWNQLSSASYASFANARAGDIIRIGSKLYNGIDIGGDYIIESINAGDIKIVGGLPIPADESSVEAITFTVVNPWAVGIEHDEVTVSVSEYAEATPTLAGAPTGACYIGEIHWDGALVVATAAYRSFGIYDSGWLAAPVIAATAPAQPGTVSHNVGLNYADHLAGASRLIQPAQIEIWAGRLSGTNIIDVQKVPFNSQVGGATAPPNGSFGWFGYHNRTTLNFLYGAKLPSGSDYGYQRKAESAGFPNDANLNASYETVQANAMYRVVVRRG